MKKTKNINEHPILFSTPMIQAILRGEKTQTRRIIKPQPKCSNNHFMFPKECEWRNEPFQPVLKNGYLHCANCGEYVGFKHEGIKCTHGKVGDILWVRETFQILPPNMVFYKADTENKATDNWKPSIFMPKDACRIFLKVKNVRVERLEDITKEDAIAEGIEKWQQMYRTRYKSYIGPIVGYFEDSEIMSDGSINGVHAAIASYRSLWAKINGFDSLKLNPWVFVYEFERLT